MLNDIIAYLNSAEERGRVAKITVVNHTSLLLLKKNGLPKATASLCPEACEEEQEAPQRAFS